MLGINLGSLPLVAYQFLKPQPARQIPAMREMMGLSISQDHAPTHVIQELVEELGVKNILIRVPSWQVGSPQYDSLLRFIEKFKEYELIINILQSPFSCNDVDLWQKQVTQIFSDLNETCSTYQIGNAVNRSKWGCRHTADVIKLFEAAHLARKQFDNIKLAGSSIIDFEPLLTLRTLLNGAQYKFDICASQLYINRRGSAFGKQYGYFDLEKKIRLIAAMLRLSNNTQNRLWITETNWPLLNTKPYTPNSGHPRSTVDEATQAEYLIQYFEVARKTGLVEKVFWWQLINPGYGLIDHRQGDLRKMPSFHAFKSLLKNSD